MTSTLITMAIRLLISVQQFCHRIRWNCSVHYGNMLDCASTVLHKWKTAYFISETTCPISISAGTEDVRTRWKVSRANLCKGPISLQHWTVVPRCGQFCKIRAKKSWLCRGHHRWNWRLGPSEILRCVIPQKVPGVLKEYSVFETSVNDYPMMQRDPQLLRCENLRAL